MFFTPNFPFDTSFGFFWLISLVLSLVGFLLLFKNRWVDIAWITILVFCKSLNGHASAYDFTYLSATLNSVHLIAAAIWAAGLTFMVIFWRKQKLYVKDFLPNFSKYALISFILLSVTGSIITFMYSPSLELLMSDWGRFLLVKLLFVVIVVLIASIIRSKIKGSNTTIGKWIKLDFSLMILIIVSRFYFNLLESHSIRLKSVQKSKVMQMMHKLELYKMQLKVDLQPSQSWVP